MIANSGDISINMPADFVFICKLKKLEMCIVQTCTLDAKKKPKPMGKNRVFLIGKAYELK